MMAKNQSPVPEQYVTVREEMFFVVTERTRFRRAAELAGTHVAGELAAAIQGRTKTPKDLEEFF